MSDLRELYQEVILDHGKHPRNFGKPAETTHLAHGDNPLCGDKVTVYLTMDGDRIAEVMFEGRGCAISMASASLMTEVLKGMTEAEAMELFGHFHALVSTEDADVGDLDKLEVLSGVRQFPMRVKCATLPWHTMKSALAHQAEPATTE